MKIKIYDIDGTLTKVKGDKATSDIFETYAFWPLLSYHFAEDSARLKAEAEAWDRSDKGEGQAFIQSSHDMLQRSIKQFKAGVTGINLQIHAKKITAQFIQEDILRFPGIEHLKRSLEADELCILSTGSYTEGAIGFAEACVERGLIPPDALDKLIISGAVIDWDTRTVQHANIANNKIIGLQERCRQKDYPFSSEAIVGIYVDDPLGNDSGLCSLKPEAVCLISTVKNQDKASGEFKPENWEDIMRREQSQYGFRVR